jgi:dCMP deaminase
MTITKWDLRFIKLAEDVSTWSKDPRRKIGAVAVDPIDRRVLSTGYNGFPKWIRDDPQRMNDSYTKSKYVIHAELNCIFNAVYTGTSLRDTTLYVYGLPPCGECAKGIIQVGIRRIVCEYNTSNEDAKWTESFAHSQTMFIEAGVELCRIT